MIIPEVKAETGRDRDRTRRQITFARVCAGVVIAGAKTDRQKRFFLFTRSCGQPAR